MGYTTPVITDINFELSSEYTAPDGTNVGFNIGTNYLVGGFKGGVFMGDSPLSGTVVNLHKRVTGELVNSIVTTASGTFTMPWPGTDEYYYMVALYPTIECNALIYDYLYPTVSGS